jgi:hypothetical protein
MGGLEIQKAEEIEGGNIMSDRRLYRTADGRIVEAGDADARFLLSSGAGDLIGPDVVKEFRLQVKDGKVVQAEPDPDRPSGQLSDAEKDALAVGLKKAAEEKRKAGLSKAQTEVALTEPAPVDEKAAAMARARKESDSKPVPETPTAPAKAPRVVSARKVPSARKSGTAKKPGK